MSVLNDEAADHGDGRQPAEKPEPGEDQKQAAAEMMAAYQDRPTIVLPGTGGMVSGTSVNDWLDEDGNPKYRVPDDAGSDDTSAADPAHEDEARKNQIEKGKALNVELAKAAADEKMRKALS